MFWHALDLSKWRGGQKHLHITSEGSGVVAASEEFEQLAEPGVVEYDQGCHHSLLLAC